MSGVGGRLVMVRGGPAAQREERGRHSVGHWWRRSPINARSMVDTNPANPPSPQFPSHDQGKFGLAAVLVISDYFISGDATTVGATLDPLVGARGKHGATCWRGVRYH